MPRMAYRLPQKLIYLGWLQGVRAIFAADRLTLRHLLNSFLALLNYLRYISGERGQMNDFTEAFWSFGLLHIVSV